MEKWADLSPLRRRTNSKVPAVKSFWGLVFCSLSLQQVRPLIHLLREAVESSHQRASDPTMYAPSTSTAGACARLPHWMRAASPHIALSLLDCCFASGVSYCRVFVHSRRGCSMHILCLGTWQTCVAEGILHLCEGTFAGSDEVSVPEQLRWAFRSFKDWLKLSRLSCSQRMFTVTNMHINSTEFPCLNAKAFNCRILVAWLAALRSDAIILYLSVICRRSIE